jgi:hypothetical protein
MIIGEAAVLTGLLVSSPAGEPRHVPRSSGLRRDHAARMREVLIQHGSVIEVSNGHQCGMARRVTRAEAYEMRVAARTPMTKPERWSVLLPDRPV